MKKTAICIIVAIWILLGIIQIYACFSLFDFLELNFFFAIIIAFIVGWIPIVGSILAIIGAVKVWEWNIINAILLLFIASHVCLYLIGGIVSANKPNDSSKIT